MANYMLHGEESCLRCLLTSDYCLKAKSGQISFIGWRYTVIILILSRFEVTIATTSANVTFWSSACAYFVVGQ